MGYTNKDYINTFTKYHECVDLNPESDDEQLYEIRTAVETQIWIEAMPQTNDTGVHRI